MALRLRRGTDTERQLIIPESGELIYTTDTKLVYIGDGVALGGLPISSGAFATDLLTDLSPQLGADLDLNSFSVTGTGAIDIIGSIGASTVNSPAVNTDALGSATLTGVRLATNLDLNNNEITGTGDIDITGTVDAVTVDATTLNVDTIDSSTNTNIQLATNLDLNNNDLVGTGNINIDGTITATGNINLGDSNDDTVSIPGTVSSNIIPSTNLSQDVGSASLRWNNGFFGNISALTISGPNSGVIFNDATGDLAVGSVTANTIYNEDSSTVYDGFTNTLNVTTITVSDILNANDELIYSAFNNTLYADQFRGDLVGSVFADDSSVFFDAINNEVTAAKGSIEEFETANISNSFGDLRIGQGIPTKTAIYWDKGGDILSLHTLDSGNSGGANLSLNHSRGTDDARLPVEPNDRTGGIIFRGWNGTEYVRNNMIWSFVDPDGTEGPAGIPGSLVFASPSNDGNDLIIAELDSHGVFRAPILRTGNYADTTARDALGGIVTGAMVLVDDNGSGTAEFQGYDGADWVPLSGGGTSATAEKSVTDQLASNYTVSASDLGSVVTLRAGGTVTLPDAASGIIPLGFYVDLINMTAFVTTIESAVGGQILSTATDAPQITPEGGVARAIKVSSSEWVVSGGITGPS